MYTSTRFRNCSRPAHVRVCFMCVPPFLVLRFRSEIEIGASINSHALHTTRQDTRATKLSENREGSRFRSPTISFRRKTISKLICKYIVFSYVYVCGCVSKCPICAILRDRSCRASFGTVFHGTGVKKKKAFGPEGESARDASVTLHPLPISAFNRSTLPRSP